MNHFICADINPWRLHNKWNPKSIAKHKIHNSHTDWGECDRKLANEIELRQPKEAHRTHHTYKDRHTSPQSARESGSKQKLCSSIPIDKLIPHTYGYAGCDENLHLQPKSHSFRLHQFSFQFVCPASSFMPTLHNCSPLQWIYTQWITRTNENRKKHTHTHTRIANDINHWYSFSDFFLLIWRKTTSFRWWELNFFCVCICRNDWLVIQLHNNCVCCIFIFRRWFDLLCAIDDCFCVCERFFFIQFQLNGSFFSPLKHFQTSTSKTQRERGKKKISNPNDLCLARTACYRSFKSQLKRWPGAHRSTLNENCMYKSNLTAIIVTSATVTPNND